MVLTIRGAARIHTTQTFTVYCKRQLGGVVVRASDLRLEIAGSIPAAALSSAAYRTSHDNTLYTNSLLDDDAAAANDDETS